MINAMHCLQSVSRRLLGSGWVTDCRVWVRVDTQPCNTQDTGAFEFHSASTLITPLELSRHMLTRQCKLWKTSNLRKDQLETRGRKKTHI